MDHKFCQNRSLQHPTTYFQIFKLNCSIPLKESCFPDLWKISPVVPIFKNAGGMVYG